MRLMASTGTASTALYTTKKRGGEHRAWFPDGRHHSCAAHPLDLIEVKPRIKREVWVNVYPHIGAGSFHLSKAQADMHADVENRIACVKLTIDCEEGEGL